MSHRERNGGSETLNSWTLWRIFFGWTNYTFKRVRCKNPERELHYGEYSSNSGLEQLESRGHTAFLFRPCSHRTCYPNQLQAAARVTFTRNFLSCLLNEVFPLLLMPAFSLVSHWMRSNCRRWGSLICVHWDQSTAKMKHKIYAYKACLLWNGNISDLR